MILVAAALLGFQPQAAPAQPASPQAAPTRAAQAAPSEALIDRFVAVLPDEGEIGAAGEIDSGELDRLVALNPGKARQVRTILEGHLACTAPVVAAGTSRMLRTIARNLGESRLRKLIGFYEGPDYAAFTALAGRMEGKAAPSAADGAAMTKLMETYPLQAFYDQMSRAEQMFTADPVFMEGAMKCASGQMEALEAAGLKSN